MLNGASLNRIAFNAAAGTALVFAAASFTAEATVTQTAIHNQALAADINANVFVSFTETHEKAAFMAMSAQGFASFPANVIWGGEADWETYSFFQPLNTRVVFAEAGFDAVAGWEAIANAVFINGDWAAFAAITIEPTLDQALKSDLLHTATFDIAGGATDVVVSRGAWGDWTADADLRSEWTFLSGGVTYHEGYTFFDGTATLDNAAEFTATFTNGGFIAAGAQWALPTQHTMAIAGNFTHVADISLDATKTQFADVALSVAATTDIEPLLTKTGESIAFTGSATMTCDPTVVQQAVLDLTANSVVEFNGEAGNALVANLIATATLVMDGERVDPAFCDLVGTASMTFPSTLYANGIVFFNGVGSSLASAGILSLVPAPDSRQFEFSNGVRNFKFSSGGDRTFGVSQ